MQTTTQYQRPQLATDWAKTPTPPPTLIGKSPTGELTIRSTDLATGLGIKHKNLLETVQAHKPDIELFGQCAFETETVKNSAGAVNEIKFIYFNENQALFVGSLSRNTVQVVAFKVTLVREFDKARKALVAKDVEAGNMELRIAALTEVVSQLSADNQALFKKLDAIDRKQEKYIEAKVVAKTEEKKSEDKVAHQEWHAKFFKVFNAYITNDRWTKPERTLESIYAKLKLHYKIDATTYVAHQRAGEHLVDTMYRLGVGAQVYEVLAYQLDKSGEIR